MEVANLDGDIEKKRLVSEMFSSKIPKLEAESRDSDVAAQKADQLSKQKNPQIDALATWFYFLI
jgi:hypothetical protein